MTRIKKVKFNRLMRRNAVWRNWEHGNYVQIILPIPSLISTVKLFCRCLDNRSPSMTKKLTMNATTHTVKTNFRHHIVRRIKHFGLELQYVMFPSLMDINFPLYKTATTSSSFSGSWDTERRTETLTSTKKYQTGSL